ncbi:GGDEF domain-containing protein [Thiohalorhabdus sp. Cl-TMA]|uniref:GGDEF domain-containing protein n=1 Tax=Thiohalorhabdus methylotrophus TaxID=3242694 RepID=A0ABV4TZ71_9GAMM
MERERLLAGGGRVVLWIEVSMMVEAAAAWRDKLETYERQACRDRLTGLPNRGLTEDRLANATARIRRNGDSLMVCFLDLDRFKALNDHWGHCLGDRLLAILAERLSGACREEDTIGRWGGDEFVGVFQVDNAPREAASRIATGFLEAVSREVTLGEDMVRVTASIGISVYRGGPRSVDDLLREADRALFRAKERGGDTYELVSLEE